MATRSRKPPPPRTYVKLPLTPVNESIVPLFTRRPPWWARNPGTAGLLVCDLIVTGAFIELTWNHWTEVKITPQSDTPSSSDLDSPAPASMVEWELRPTWQRFGLCGAHFLFGCLFAGGLLGLKSQFIRSVTILPNAAATTAGTTKAAATGTSRRAALAAVAELPKTAVVQTASHPKNVGWEFPLRSSWLEEGRDKKELMLRCGDVNSRWFLGLDGASINGKQCVSNDEARSLLINAWKTIRPGVATKA